MTPGAKGSGEMASRHGGVQLRRIVGARCLVSPVTERHLFSWRRLAEMLGSNHMSLKRWHAEGVDKIVNALNRRESVAQRPQ
jgi:hypothetical protein